MYLNNVCNLWENCELSVKCKKHKKAEGQVSKSAFIHLPFFLLCFEHRYRSSGYDEPHLLFSAHEGFS